jgi:hypothetical protein
LLAKVEAVFVLVPCMAVVTNDIDAERHQRPAVEQILVVRLSSSRTGFPGTYPSLQRYNR